MALTTRENTNLAAALSTDSGGAWRHQWLRITA